MQNFRSIMGATFASLLLAACSSSTTPVEQASEQELFSTGQSYLQDGDFSQATRYLEAVDTRYPGSTYSEQAQLNLIYVAYKTQDYTKALTTADRFLQQHSNSSHVDYVLYMAALTNSALGDNFFQDFFGVDRSTRENTTLKTAFSNFQTLVQHFPNSPYTPDALARMAYIKDRLARHELDIAKFYAKRNAWVAVSNRITGMLRTYPDTHATFQALPLLQESYEKLGLTELAQNAARLVEANKNKEIREVEKPKDPILSLPSWMTFGLGSGDKEQVVEE